MQCKFKLQDYGHPEIHNGLFEPPEYYSFIDCEILMFNNAIKAHSYTSKVSNPAHQRDALWLWLAAASVYNLTF